MGKSFLGVSSIVFSRGSVIVGSIVRLSAHPSDDQRSGIANGVIDTFERNGFVVDDFSIQKTNGKLHAVCRFC